MKNIEQFLKKIGVPSSTISKLQDEEDVNVEEFATAYKDSFKDVLQNDPDFIQPIKDEVRGTELSKIEHKIKKTFALEADEIKGKKFDEIISLAFEKTKNTVAGGADELQSKMIELSKENKRLLEEVIPAKEAEATNQIKTFKKDLALRSTLSKKSLIVSPEIVLPAIQNYLSSQYEIDVLDSGELDVKTKTGLKPLNQDGTKALSFDEILDAHLTNLQVIKQSNAGTQQAAGKQQAIAQQQQQQAAGEATKFNLPHLQKAQANAERLQAMKTFGKE